MATSLTSLPEEVLEIITGHLSLRDVTACSGVNRSLRAAFDKDRIWRRFCTFHPNYFHKQVSKLKCPKKAFEGCEARQQLFKELFVQKNLLQNKLHKANVKTKITKCFNVKNAVDEEGNHWLFIFGETKQMKYELQMWNLNKNPVLQSTATIPFEDELQLDTFRIAYRPNIEIKIKKGKLFCTANSFVFVYDFFSPLYNLNFLFRVVGPQPNSKFSKILHVNSLFFCFFRENENDARFACIRVWDEKGSVVFKSESAPELRWDYYSHSVDYKNSDMILVNTQRILNREDNCGTEYTVKLFNVKTFQYSNIFTGIVLDHYDCILLAGDIVCIYETRLDQPSILKCFDSKGKYIFSFISEDERDELSRTGINTHGDWDLFSRKGSNTFGMIDSTGIIVGLFKVNPLTKEIIECSEIECSEIPCIEYGEDEDYRECHKYHFASRAVTLNENLLFISMVGGGFGVWDMKSDEHVAVLNGFLPVENWKGSLNFINTQRSPSKIVALHEGSRENNGKINIDVISAW